VPDRNTERMGAAAATGTMGIAALTNARSHGIT